VGCLADWEAVRVGSTPWKTYVRIADALRGRLSAAEPGTALPSEAELAAEFGVARNTVRRALAELEREELISTLPGRGRVVRPLDGSTVANYRRIAADLERRITDGDLTPGQRAPSEAELMAEYGVSRGTARQGLSVLEAASLVTAVHGKGRFVNETGRA
jgi:DNA-binding GntR family transcriptional regulator